MGSQSSRIIWGKKHLPSGENIMPVQLYISTDIVYTSGNYCIYSASSGSVAPDYKLYLCTAAETGGTFFNNEDWKEQKGVKNWALQGYRVYKVGARVIKEMHGEEYEYVDEHGDIQRIELDGVYLFKCIAATPYDHAWHPECWELVFQDVPVSYIVQDHKDVYYDDGHNHIKWHRMMYYIPPEGIQEMDLEVGEHDINWLYHYGDMCLSKPLLINEFRLYKYKNTMPKSGEFNIADWEMVTNKLNDVETPVQMYQTYTEYDIGNMVIKLGITINLQVICPYNGYGLKYSISKYCLHIIDKDDYIRREIAAGERLFPNWYRDKIVNGEELYGLFRATSVEGNGDGNFNPYHWDLINYRDGHYVMQWVPVNNGDPYVVGDERIYYYADPNGGTSSIMGLCRCIQDHITPTTANCPTNGEFWQPVTQYIDGKDGYKAYKALRHISAEDNTHFETKNWAVVTHSTLIDDESEFYGIIWEKYGLPGTDGFVYCFLFTSIGPYNNGNSSYKGRFCMFLPAYYDDGILDAQTDFTLYLGNGRRLSGSGFNTIRNYKTFSYGLPELHGIGNSVFANFLYVARLEEGWKRSEFTRYFDFRKFTALENYSFFAEDENGDIYKVNFYPGSMASEELVIFSASDYSHRFYDSEFISVERIITLISINTCISGIYAGQALRRYSSGSYHEYGEHCTALGLPPGPLKDSQYLFEKDCDDILASDLESTFGVVYSDYYVGNYGGEQDFQPFCNVWGLTYSNGYILNYPNYSKEFVFYDYSTTSFLGDMLYVLRCAMSTSSNDLYFLGKLIIINKDTTIKTVHNILITDIPFNLNIYCRYSNYLYGITNAGVWSINLSEPDQHGNYTLAKIRSFSNYSEIEDACCVKGIPYVTGSQFTFEGHVIASLTLYFVDGYVSRNHFIYDNTDQTLSVYIPINDRNIFSCNTGLAAQGSFGLFFNDRISSGSKHYGIYIYLPEFDGINCSNKGGFYWISYGYEDYVNGPFIGGAGTDRTNF